MVTFCDGARKSSPAAIPSATDLACISLSAEVIERSRPVSMVQPIAATWPGGVTVPRPYWLPGRTGPFSVHFSCTVTGGASLTRMIEARVSIGLKPSGVSTSPGASGLSFSMNTS